MNKIIELISLACKVYKNKVANELLTPEDEKMMQLQLVFILHHLREQNEK